jgi:trimeric autotransporter adhesin
MKNKFCIALLMLLIILQNSINAQNTFPSTGAAGIGTTTPDASSLLEIKSTSKGILIPRMTKTQRDAVVNPATSLMIYQTNSSPGFYYYNGSSWAAILFKGANKFLSNLTSPTAVNVDILPDINNLRNIGNESALWKNIYADSFHFSIGTIDDDAVINGITVGRGLNGSNGNVAIGYNALLYNNGGKQNIALGDLALQNNSTGNFNIACGYEALIHNTNGSYNVASGDYSLYQNTNGNYNTANGSSALLSNTGGSGNTANGYNASYFNTNGYYNTATGGYALYSDTTGSFNVATGYNVLYANTIGNFNAASGYEALTYNTTGSYNAANGAAALYSNTIGNYNTAEGSNALYLNKGGSNNTANGYSALHSAVNANYNTANGGQTLYKNVSGSNNTAEGFNAGYNITDGSNNTFLGTLANCGSGGHLTNSMALGYLATVTVNNHIVIGNNNITSIGGYTNWSNISDGRVKKNIKQNVPGLEFINKLQPITYNLNLDAADKIIARAEIKDKEGKTIQPSADDITARKQKEQIVYTGFIAQDVEKAAKDLNYDFSGVDKPDNANTLYGLRYSDFVVPLVKAVQELSKQNDSLKNELNTKIAAQQKEIDELKMMVISSQSTVIGQHSSAFLSQNIPNPFSNSTTINYSLPKQFSSARIIITDKNGTALKTVTLSNNKGVINIDAAILSSGAYQYSLYVDQKLIASKQMIISK